MSEWQRLDKYLASVSDFSRKEIKKLIKLGEVVVNDAIACDPALKVSQDCDVTLCGEETRQSGFRYYKLFKPEGVVSAAKDSQRPTVLDLLMLDNSAKLHIAGRLDIDTTGLILITDDGQWTHSVISPNRGCNKVYQVTTTYPITEETIKRLTKGVLLPGEKKRCGPAQLTLIDENSCQLIISEGKYHQIKRMFAMFDNPVTSLHREQIGAIKLDEDMAVGDFKALTQQEINSVAASATNHQPVTRLE